MESRLFARVARFKGLARGPRKGALKGPKEACIPGRGALESVHGQGNSARRNPTEPIMLAFILTTLTLLCTLALCGDLLEAAYAALRRNSRTIGASALILATAVATIVGGSVSIAYPLIALTIVCAYGAIVGVKGASIELPPVAPPAERPARKAPSRVKTLQLHCVTIDSWT